MRKQGHWISGPTQPGLGDSSEVERDGSGGGAGGGGEGLPRLAQLPPEGSCPKGVPQQVAAIPVAIRSAYVGLSPRMVSTP